MPKSIPQNRERWKQLILEQAASGLSRTEFCLQNNLKAHQFHYYKSIFTKTKKSSFTEIKVKSEKAPAKEPQITIRYNELTITFEGKSDLEDISTFCHFLGSSK